MPSRGLDEKRIKIVRLEERKEQQNFFSADVVGEGHKGQLKPEQV